MKNGASCGALISLSVLALAGCHIHTDNGTNTGKIKTPPTTVFVDPVKAKTADEVASRTRSLIAALRGAGFNAVLASDADKTEKAKPYVTVHVESNEENCLEGLVKITPATGAPTQSEMRQFRSQGLTRLSQDECSDAFTKQIVAALNR